MAGLMIEYDDESKENSKSKIKRCTKCPELVKHRGGGINIIWVLFYFNSLPDFPKGCKIIPENLLLRDFFKCNPTNTGHYQYPKFETLSYDEGCHKGEVKNFIKKSDPEKYVVFYTRNTDMNKKSKNKIVGYFKVGKIDKFDEKSGFYSAETVLLSKEDCIEIDYSGRGVPVSWGDSSVKDEVSAILRDLRKLKDSPHNKTRKYQEETKEIMKSLKPFEERKIKEFFSLCEECPDKRKCFLWRKRGMRENSVNYLHKLYAVKKCV